MQNAPSPSGPTLPWMLVPVVHLLRWSREQVGAVAGQPTARLRGSVGLGGVLFVVARSWGVVKEKQAA